MRSRPGRLGVYWEQQPPTVESQDDPRRREEKLLEILPADPRRTYDMHEIIKLIVDDGEFLEIMAGYAKSAIVDCATVPRVCILVRKAYGGTLPIFCAEPHAADFACVWPTGEYAPMGADGAVAIIYDSKIKELETSEERLAFAEKKKKEYFDEYVDPLKTAANLRWDFFDDIIDPRKTRETIIHALSLGTTIKNRVSPRPRRKQGNRPV